MKKETPETDPSKMNEEEKIAHKERVDLLANKMQLLFGFAADLIPDIEILERVAATSSERQSMALTMAPLLGAAGMDYEEKEAEWKMKSKRADALVNLIKVLRDTEEDRKKFQEEKMGRAQGRDVLNRMFGG